MQRHCVLLRDAGRRADRGASPTRSTSTCRPGSRAQAARAPLDMRLALRGRYPRVSHASMEESARAIDSLVARRRGRARGGTRPPQVLSFADRQRSGEPGRQARQLDALRCAQGGRVRHPPGEHGRRAGASSTASTACSTHAATIQGIETGRAGDLAPEGAGRTRHRRAPRAAGRQLPRRGRRPRDRPARLDHAEHPRRGRGDAHPRQARDDRGLRLADARRARLRRAIAGRAARAGRGTLRHAAGDRPDRLGQDHHALRRADRDPQRPRQDHHDRGPGRIPAARDPADSGQREEGADLRARACARSCGTTRTRSWSARSATARPPRSRCSRR